MGPYEIVAPIGAGGMGEVYRARDTRLDRTVAIKILPAEFAQDAKLRLRFEREAKAISSLSHPHICALYDVGPEYLVMEHCEGKTLAKRIADGPLPLEQVLQYGMQIADALDKAHRQGIIHRDLKPTNIMLTKSGVKLLDFGFAKQRVDSSPEQSTVQQVTEEGKILGTIQYMAPELIHGKEADARSDIFALAENTAECHHRPVEHPEIALKKNFVRSSRKVAAMKDARSWRAYRRFASRFAEPSVRISKDGPGRECDRRVERSGAERRRSEKGD